MFISKFQEKCEIVFVHVRLRKSINCNKRQDMAINSPKKIIRALTILEHYHYLAGFLHRHHNPE